MSTERDPQARAVGLKRIYVKKGVANYYMLLSLKGDEKQVSFSLQKGNARRLLKEGKYEATKTPSGDNFRFAIETLEGELVGSINSHSCDKRNGTFKYGVGIFREHWRNGYASDAVKILLRYFFEELRYEKVNAHVYAFNENSIRLHERLGFQLEGRIRNMIYTNGRHFDELIFGLLRNEYE